jgi:hypothetical protein
MFGPCRVGLQRTSPCRRFYLALRRLPQSPSLRQASTREAGAVVGRRIGPLPGSTRMGLPRRLKALRATTEPPNPPGASPTSEPIAAAARRLTSNEIVADATLRGELAAAVTRGRGVANDTTRWVRRDYVIGVDMRLSPVSLYLTAPSSDGVVSVWGPAGRRAAGGGEAGVVRHRLCSELCTSSHCHQADAPMLMVDARSPLTSSSLNLTALPSGGAVFVCALTRRSSYFPLTVTFHGDRANVSRGLGDKPTHSAYAFVSGDRF